MDRHLPDWFDFAIEVNWRAGTRQLRSRKRLCCQQSYGAKSLRFLKCRTTLHDRKSACVALVGAKDLSYDVFVPIAPKII